MTPDSAFVVDLFEGVGGVSAKRMFGGLGVYADGVMFALVTGEGSVCIKADDQLKSELKLHGSTPFLWIPPSGPRAGKPVEMGYWRLPENALDDPEEAAVWGRKALAVAQAAKAGRKPRAKKAAKAKPTRKGG
jgi:DNA transformation protein